MATTLDDTALYWQDWWVLMCTGSSDMAAQPVLSAHFSILSTRNQSCQIPWRSPGILSLEAQKKSIWYDLFLRSPCWVLTITVSCPCRISAKQDSLGYRIPTWENQKEQQLCRLTPVPLTGLLKDADSSLGLLSQALLVSSQTQGLKSVRMARASAAPHWSSSHPQRSLDKRGSPLRAKELNSLISHSRMLYSPARSSSLTPPSLFYLEHTRARTRVRTHTHIHTTKTSYRIIIPLMCLLECLSFLSSFVPTLLFWEITNIPQHRKSSIVNSHVPNTQLQ